MMKKFALMLFCLVLALPAFSLAEEAAASPSLPAFEWERNGLGHWHVLENGEKADIGAHALENVLCTVCGSEVWLYDDLSADVYDYDEFGNLLRYSSFDTQEELIYEMVYVLECDEEGRVLTSREYVDGVLVSESAFTISAEGESIPATQKTWYDDGAWTLNEYDEHGNCVRATSYDAENNLAAETLSEYMLGSDGWYYEAKSTTLMDGYTFYSEINEYGDTIRSLYTDDTGNVFIDIVYEYEYLNGALLWRKQYDHGRLSVESICDGEWNSVVKETEYYDDGTSIVSEFNDVGDPVHITFLAADGTVEMTQAFEYKYDEHSTQLSCKAYVNDALVLHTEYAFNEDGWNYIARETMYNEDGTYIVCLFDENEELTSETIYDASGNVIE